MPDPDVQDVQEQPSQSAPGHASARPMPVARPWNEGWRWIKQAGALFRLNPMLWILGCLLFIVALALVGSIPLVGSLASSLLSPVISAGFIYAFSRADQGETVQFGDLLAGFRVQTSALVTVGALFLLAEILLLLLFGGLAVLLFNIDPVQLMEAQPASLQSYGMALLLAVLGFLLFAIPLLMAYWFAPALVIMDGMPPLQAFRLSFDACLMNIPPFLLYGLVTLVLFVIAVLPLFLGLIILGPILLASQYTSYHSIFHGPRGTLL